MKRLMLLLGIVGVALVVAPVGITKTPKQDSAFGSGVRAPSCTGSCTAGTFSFTASSGPNGQNATGTFVVDFPGFAGFTADVICFHVSGHTATFFGQISAGTGAADPTTLRPPIAPAAAPCGRVPHR